MLIYWQGRAALVKRRLRGFWRTKSIACHTAMNQLISTLSRLMQPAIIQLKISVICAKKFRLRPLALPKKSILLTRFICWANQRSMHCSKRLKNRPSTLCLSWQPLTPINCQLRFLVVFSASISGQLAKTKLPRICVPLLMPSRFLSTTTPCSWLLAMDREASAIVLVC